MEEVLQVQEGLRFHHHHDQQYQQQQRHRREQRLRYIELRRLLYCMQHHEGLPGNKYTNNNNGIGNDSNSSSSLGRQSWQSLLFRAQMCQDLWHQVAHEWSSTDRGHDDDDGENDPDGRREYNALSREVDTACRRAHELAEQARLEQQQQQRQQQIAFNNNTTDIKKDGGDLIQRLFLSPMNEQSSVQVEDDDNEGDGTEDMDDDYDEDNGEEEEEDGSYESEEGEDSNHPTPSHSKRRGHNHHHRRHTNNEVSTADLQESQREQMEEAISQMARQMKEATQHIQGRIQQQTGTTLNELEVVAEENVNDVTQVAKDVSEHNSDTTKSTWATWTVLIALVGVFCFSLVTIFTIPKSPSACLFMCGNNNQNSWPVRLLAKTTDKVGTMVGSMLDTIATTVEQISNGDFPREDIPSEDGSDSWSHIYDEDEELRREKERLDKLLQSMNDPSGGSDSGKDAANDDENPWGINSVDDDDGELGRRRESGPNEASISEDGSINIQEQDQNGEDAPDVDVDEILASLKKRMDEQQVENEHDQYFDDESTGQTDPPTGASSDGGSAADSFDRGNMARERFAPKDVRVAAAADDYDTLQRYLSISVEHINRQDKHGWTALHFAVSNGHERIVDLLLSHGSDPTVETKTGQTVLDVALEKLDQNSPISRAIMKAMGHDDYEDEDVPETTEQESEDDVVAEDFSGEDDAHTRELDEGEERRRLEAEEAERRRLEEEEQARQEEEEKQRRLEAEEVEQRRLREEERARQQQEEERRRRVEAEEAEQRRLEEEQRARQQEEEEERRRVEAEEAEQRRLDDERLEEQRRATEEYDEDAEAHDAKRKQIFTPPPLEDEDDDEVHHHDVDDTEMNQRDEL